MDPEYRDLYNPASVGHDGKMRVFEAGVSLTVLQANSPLASCPRARTLKALTRRFAENMENRGMQFHLLRFLGPRSDWSRYFNRCSMCLLSHHIDSCLISVPQLGGDVRIPSSRLQVRIWAHDL